MSDMTEVIPLAMLRISYTAPGSAEPAVVEMTLEPIEITPKTWSNGFVPYNSGAVNISHSAKDYIARNADLFDSALRLLLEEALIRAPVAA